MEKFIGLNKEELELEALERCVPVDEGYENALELYLECKKAIHYYNTILNHIGDTAFSERSDYPEKELIKYGAKVSISSTGDRLDYDKDVEYLNRKNKLKEREQLLKLAYKSSDEIIDSEGIVVDRIPIKSKGKSVLKIQL